MSAIYLLIPLAMIVLLISVWLFFWAVKRGQFDDLESPGHSILFDDDKPASTPVSKPVTKPATNAALTDAALTNETRPVESSHGD